MKKLFLFLIPILVFISSCTNQNTNDYKIIDVHEHIQSEKELSKIVQKLGFLIH